MVLQICNELDAMQCSADRLTMVGPTNYCPWWRNPSARKPDRTNPIRAKSCQWNPTRM